MTRKELISEIVELFCSSDHRFESATDRVNDLNELEWSDFQDYLKSYSKYPWLDSVTLMDVVDSVCDDYVKFGMGV